MQGNGSRVARHGQGTREILKGYPSFSGVQGRDTLKGYPTYPSIRSRWVALWLAGILFVSFAFFLPHWDWNQTARLDTTVALVNHNTVAIDRYQANTGDKDFYAGHYYSGKSPGQSLIGVPIYAAYKGFLTLKGNPPADTADDDASRYVEILLTCGIPATLLLLLFFWFLGYFSTSVFNRAVLTLALGLATNIFAYAQNLFGHVPVTTLLFGGFVLVWILTHEDASRGKVSHWLKCRPTFTACLAGFAFGMAFLFEYPPVLIAILIGIYALTRLPLRLLVLMVVGALPPLLVVLGYDYAAYHNPLTLGYTSGASVLFKGAQTQGFGGLVWPPKPEAMWGMSFSPYRGLFFLSPFLLLALPGFWLWRRKGGWEWLLCLAIVIIFFFTMTMYVVWDGGVVVGPRFLVPILPFLALPTIFVLDGLSRMGSRQVLQTALQGLAAGFFLLSLLNVWAETIGGRAILFPPENNYNPLFTVNLPALARGEIYPNRGINLGLSGGASLLPLLLFLVVWTVTVVAVGALVRREMAPESIAPS